MELSATEYVRRGNMLILRGALDITDSENYPSLWIAKYGSITDFPWEEVFKEHAKEARVEYFRRMRRLSPGQLVCPHCGNSIE
jgi:hypothetical protein